MANNIPVFEFGKDSYILRHELNYKTTTEDEWSAVTFGILFTDYDLARKTQSSNSENFSPVIITGSTDNIGAFRLTHYDEEWTLGLFNRWIYSGIVSGGTSFGDRVTIVATPSRTLTFSGSTIKSSSGSFISDFYTVGDIIKITGTTSNDGYKKISYITTTGITTTSGFTTEPTYTSNATIIGPSGATFLSDRRYQAYYIPSGYTFLFQVADYVNIYFHGVSGITGLTTWEHFGPAGETWVATGTTDSGIPWQTGGTTTINGYSSGITNYYVVNFEPILKYRAQIIEVGTNYLKLERKLEDYIYNNIMKLAADTDYDYVFYTIESLDFADRSYYGIKYIFEETKWAPYFSLTATTDQLIIQPVPNKADLYFDYDNVEFITFYSGGTQITYKFTTNNLYTKYKLDRFLDQLGYDSGTTVFYPYSAATYSSGYTDTLEFDVVLVNSGDSAYYRENTFLYMTGTTSSNHIALLKKISGGTLTVISPRVSMAIGEQITWINNMSSSYDISRMLYECYINIENGVTSTFYDADLYDPNVFGPNVIDPNILGPWAFDPRAMNVIGTGVSFAISDLINPCIMGSDSYDVYVIGIDSGVTSWYVTGNTSLFTVTPSGGTANTMGVIVQGKPTLGSGNIEFRWTNNGALAYSFPISILSTC